MFFFDEAHLLFEDASDAFLEQVAQTVRLIRSKGVGVFFVTQLPDDMPEEVLGQFGNRVQHARRAFTPQDAKALKTAATTYPKSDFYDIDELLTSMGIGEAMVRPCRTGRADTRRAHEATSARVAHRPRRRRHAAAKGSPLYAKYGTRVEAESAREKLAARMRRRPSTTAEPTADKPRKRRSKARAPAPSGGTDAIGDFLTSVRARRWGSRCCAAFLGCSRSGFEPKRARRCLIGGSPRP